MSATAIARRSRVPLAVLAVAAAIAAPAAMPHGTSPPTTFSEETLLRKTELATLGATHAAEHAARRVRVRSLILSGRAAASKAAPRKKRLKPVSRAHDATLGAWGAPFPIPVMGINAVLLPTGKVLYFAYPKNPNRAKNGNIAVPNESFAYVWDPSKGTGSAAFTAVHPPVIDPATGRRANIWCAGQTHLSDGRIIVAGGNDLYEGYDPLHPAFKGLDRVYIFDPFTETWQEQEKMDDGRWYPTLVRLGDSRVLITGGLDKTGDYASPYNRDIELFTPSPTPGAAGTISLVGKRANTNSPTHAGPEPPNGGLYPHQFLMPDGRVVTLGPYIEDSWVFSSPGNSMAWTDLPNLAARRMWGMSVLMPGGTQGSSKVMMIGGSNTAGNPANAPATTTTETIDPILSPTWTPSTSLSHGRSHGQVVILPDGSLAAVGGGEGVQGDDLWVAEPNTRKVEIRDPDTGIWKVGAAQAEARAYHSTALLLPDATVISAGDDFNGGFDQDTAEIYAPPYLFRGPRPVITSVPASMRYGVPIRVRSTGAVAKAVLIAPGSATHAVDMNQRYVPVTMTQTATGVQITTPPNANVAPAGYYMLFLLSPDGVPSVARFVKLDPAAPDQPPDPPVDPPVTPPTAPPTPTLPPGSPGSPLPTARVAAGVGFRLSAPRSVAQGKAVRVVARLQRAVPRSKAILQRKVGSRYQTLTSRSFSGSSVAITVKLARPGAASLRVVIGRPGVAPERRSVTVRVVATR